MVGASQLRRLGLALMLASLTVCAVPLRAQDESRNVKMSELLQEAVDLYELKQFVSAKAKLDAILAMNPSHAEAHKLRSVVGEEMLAKMMAYCSPEGRDLGMAPTKLLASAMNFDRSQNLDPDMIRKLVGEALRGDLKVLVKIRDLGQFAVPELVGYLKTRSGKEDRVNASAVLSSLGQTAVAPLVEALNTADPLQKQGILQVFDEMRGTHPRIIAPLKRICEDKDELGVIKEWASRVLEATTGQKVAELKSAADYYYLEANRYYLNPEDVQEEMDLLDGILWRWDEAKQTLVYSKVPMFVLPGLLSEEYIFDAMKFAGDDKRFPVLLSSLYILEKSIVDRTSQSLNLNSLASESLKSSLGKSTEWQNVMKKNASIACTAGPQTLLAVLEKALADGKPTVAVCAIDLMSDTLSSNGGWTTIAPQAVEGQQVEHCALLGALDFPHRAVRVAAANCLVRIDYPVNGEKYPLLLPTLIEGAQEYAGEVVLVASPDGALRTRFSEAFVAKDMNVITAADGRGTVSQGIRFPFKDSILIDGDMAEFAMIKARLEYMGLADNTPLPLTIITSRDRVPMLAEQFEEDDYSIEVLNDQKAEDSKLFRRLASMVGRGGRENPVAIITNENEAERVRIKQLLEMQVEKYINPGAQDLVATMLATGSEGLKSGYVNVFLDTDLSGYDAMRTYLALQKDPRTNPVPVGILVSDSNRKRIADSFAEMIDAKKVALISRDLPAPELVDEVRAMRKKNILSQNKYVRQEAAATALRSAKALSLLDSTVNGLQLTKQQEAVLSALVRNREDEKLLIALSDALGHFYAKGAVLTLSNVVKSTTASLELRETALKAMGRIDTAGSQHEFKLSLLMHDPESSIQALAASAIALERADEAKRIADFEALRVGTGSAGTPIVKEGEVAEVAKTDEEDDGKVGADWDW